MTSTNYQRRSAQFTLQRIIQLGCWILIVSTSGPATFAQTPIGRTPGSIERQPIDSGVLRVEFFYDDSNRLVAERFELPESVPVALARLAVGDIVIAKGFPVGPGIREDVRFERVDLYAPGAKVYVQDEDGFHEIPRSNRVQLLGTGVSDSTIRVGVSLDPSGGEMSGVVSHYEGAFDFTQTRAASTSSVRPVYEVSRGSAERGDPKITTTCNTEDRPLYFDPPQASISSGASVESAGVGGGPTHSAVVAFDTDTEFVGDYASTAAAGAAIADLVTSMNVLYERDFMLRLLQGTTLLRTSDPYTATSTLSQLDEFGEWWEANQGAVSRVFAAFLSGKGFSNGFSCSGAGIAWVDSYCDNTQNVAPPGLNEAGSYSATQVLRCVPLNGTGNTNLIGHELGHNAGSPHTHCYVPEIDQCYNAQAGCWAGAVSCPNWVGTIPGIAANKGTTMSYCNFGPSSGADCGQTEPFFHPTVNALVKMKVADNTNPMCVQTLGGGGCPMGVPGMVTVSTHQTTNSTYQACDKITATSGFGVDPGVEITLQSWGTIEFQPGASAMGQLNAKIGD